MITEIDVAQAFVDRCVDRLNAGELDAADAAKAKWWCTELQGRVIDRCLQLHGGYGYMTEYPIARRYADARVTRIYGGTTEIMKSVVSKSLGPVMRFVLASASPARLATLRARRPRARGRSSAASTRTPIDGRPTARTGRKRSPTAKAQAVAERVDGAALVLGCDSLLELDGEALGKPGRCRRRRERWRAMRGRTGVLHTGHACIDTAGRSVARRRCRPTSTSPTSPTTRSTRYCATGEPSAVAGAFTDRRARRLVRRAASTATTHNVVGVSLPALRAMLRRARPRADRPRLPAAPVRHGFDRHSGQAVATTLR